MQESAVAATEEADGSVEPVGAAAEFALAMLSSGRAGRASLRLRTCGPAGVAQTMGQGCTRFMAACSAADEVDMMGLMLDRSNMAARAVQISIDEGLLKRIDKDRETREKGRSEFIRSAVRAYLKAKERRAVDDAIRAAYADASAEMEIEVRDMMDVQAWPEK